MSHRTFRSFLVVIPALALAAACSPSEFEDDAMWRLDHCSGGPSGPGEGTEGDTEGDPEGGFLPVPDAGAGSWSGGLGDDEGGEEGGDEAADDGCGPS